MTKTAIGRIIDTIHAWIVDHDDHMSFTILYVGGAIFLSVFMNLFWVACLMLLHLAIEIWRHMILGHRYPLLQSLWCVKLDIALVMFALVVALYSDMIFGLLGIGQAARAARAVAGAEMLSRIAIIERGVKVFFLTVDDMSRVTHLLIKSIRKNKDVTPEQLAELVDDHSETIPQDGRITKGDIFALAFMAVCSGLIIASAFILPEGLADTARIIIGELTP